MEAFYNLSSFEEQQLRKRKAKMKHHLQVTPSHPYPAPSETFLDSPRFLLWSPFCPLKRPRGPQLCSTASSEGREFAGCL